MRKRIAVFLALAVFLMLAACGSSNKSPGSSNENPLAGTWIIDHSASKSGDISFDGLHDHFDGGFSIITFYNDGTYSTQNDQYTDFGRDETHGRYTIIHDGTAISFDDAEEGMADDPVSFKVSNNTLTLTDFYGDSAVYRKK